MWNRIGKNGERFWGKKGAGIFFTNGESVLLLKRSKKCDNAGTWGLPGGKSEEGETQIGTATREAREECGTLQGRRIDSLEENNGSHRWTTFFYKVTNPFDCKLNDEHTEFQWIPINRLEAYTLHPKLRASIDRHVSIVAKHFGSNMNFKEWLSFHGDGI